MSLTPVPSSGATGQASRLAKRGRFAKVSKGEELKETFSRLMGGPVSGLRRLSGGLNSQVYRLTGPDGQSYAGKVYFRHSNDTRDRLTVEFDSISFLVKNGIDCVPQPINADREKGIAVYQYIEGRKLSKGEIDDACLDSAVSFLLKLKELRSRPDSRWLPVASEAFFSLAGIIENLNQRSDRLKGVKKKGDVYGSLSRFLEEDFFPAFKQITLWTRSRLSASNIDIYSELPQIERTLSPSDFGFHNALMVETGRMVWLDFEYFGWDDPAKTICDLLLHPAMDLDQDAKHRLVREILSGFKESKNLLWRLETVYPLFGLKWCLILLNEFLEEELERRGFAAKEALDRSETQWRQLGKAQCMLEKVLSEYEKFSYF